MKYTVRRSVFETNSSTNHTLSIRKCSLDKSDVFNQIKPFLDENGVLTVGKTTYTDLMKYINKDVIHLYCLGFQTKIDILFYAAFISYEAKDFVLALNDLSKILKRYDIKIKFDIENLIEAADNYLDEGILALVSRELFKEEDILNFLFSKEVYYTEWCDECNGQPSEEIEKIENKMYNDKDVIIIDSRM